MSIAELSNRFNYHKPNEDRVNRHERVRAAVKYVALFVDEWCPDGMEKSTAITKLEEAMFWANAAIAREPTDD